MLLPEIKYSGQKKLQNSRVLIIGAGGIGSPAAYYISGMGVGKIGIIDHDTVDESNLHRQIIHNSDRKGMNKALSAKLTISRFNPRVQVEAYPFQLTKSNAQQLFAQYDIILDASDNPKTRYLVNDAAIITGKPLVSGSAIGWEGQLTVFGYDGGPCYRCLYPECPKAGSVRSCGDAGVVGMIPGVIGLLQAVECMKILIETPKQKILNKRMLIFDAHEATFKTFKIRAAQKGCLSCCKERSDGIKDVENFDYDSFVGESCSAFTISEHLFENITWSDFIKRQGEDEEKILIDVRPAAQYDIINLPMFSNIPYEDLLLTIDDQQAAVKLSEIIGPKEKSLFIMCRRGNLSRLAGNALVKKAGYQKVYNIVGGINEYGKQFDSNVPFV